MLHCYVYVVFVGISTVGNGDGSDLTLIIEVPTQLKSGESLRVVYQAPLNPEIQDGTYLCKTNYDTARDVMTISKICIYSKVNTLSIPSKRWDAWEKGGSPRCLLRGLFLLGIVAFYS